MRFIEEPRDPVESRNDGTLRKLARFLFTGKITEDRGDEALDDRTTRDATVINGGNSTNKRAASPYYTVWFGEAPVVPFTTLSDDELTKIIVEAHTDPIIESDKSM